MIARESIKSGVVAAGTTQATATLLTASYNQVSTSTASASGVLLQAVLGGYKTTVRNDGADVCQCWPPVGAQINGLGVNNSYFINVGQQVTFIESDIAGDYFAMADAKPPRLGALIAAAKTINVSESGSTYAVSQAGAYNITLPAPTVAGQYYRFIVTVTGGNLVKVDCGAGLLSGNGIICATPTSITTGVTPVQFLGFVATCPIGSWAEFVSDGTNWYCFAFCGVAAKIAFS